MRSLTDRGHHQLTQINRVARDLRGALDFRLWNENVPNEPYGVEKSVV